MTMPAKTHDVFEVLKRCAKEMRTITYGELGELTNIAPVGIGNQLGHIRDEVCRQRRIPWLNALAVNKETRRPGESFLPQGFEDRGRDNELFWRGMVLQVFAIDWDSIEL